MATVIIPKELVRRVEIHMKETHEILTYNMIGFLDNNEHWVFLTDEDHVVQHIPKYDIERMSVHPPIRGLSTDPINPEMGDDGIIGYPDNDKLRMVAWKCYNCLNTNTYTYTHCYHCEKPREVPRDDDEITTGE